MGTRQQRPRRGASNEPTREARQTHVTATDNLRERRRIDKVGRGGRKAMAVHVRLMGPQVATATAEAMKRTRKQRVFVTLNHEDQRTLSKIAAEKGDTLAALCRRVIHAYLRRQRETENAPA